MKKDAIKKEFAGLVLTMFVGLFGTGTMADYNEEKLENKSVSQEINNKKK